MLIDEYKMVRTNRIEFILNTMKKLREIYSYWNLVIRYDESDDDKRIAQMKYLEIKRDNEVEPLLDWLNENTNIDLKYLDQSIIEYELKKRDIIEGKKEKKRDNDRPKTIIKKEKKTRLPYKLQLKKAKERSKKEIKKWLKDPKTGNWWVDAFNRTKAYNSSIYHDKYDYTYKESYETPLWLIEIDYNEWCLNKSIDRDFDL